jgi:hypothetical protein
MSIWKKKYVRNAKKTLRKLGWEGDFPACSKQHKDCAGKGRRAGKGEGIRDGWDGELRGKAKSMQEFNTRPRCTVDRTFVFDSFFPLTFVEKGATVSDFTKCHTRGRKKTALVPVALNC